MIMKMNFIVENVFAYARPGARACICIVVVNGNQIRNVAKSLKLDSDQSLESLCKKPEVEAAVLEILQRHGMDHGLARRELPMGLHLTSEPWTPEGGMVGPAFKLRRKVIEKHFREEIDALYSLEPSHTGN